MPQRLPSIDIAVRGLPQQVLAELADAARSLDKFEVEVAVDSAGGDAMHLANVRLKQSTIHRQLGLQFIYFSQLKERISVEVRASRWLPDDPPTYATYVQAAKDIASPILKAYNSRHNTLYRLRIQSQSSLVPKLTPAAEKLFLSFIRHANTSALHPLDWQRMYRFVWKSRGVPLHEEDMAALLEKHGFTSEYAARVASICVHLHDFKGFR